MKERTIMRVVGGIAAASVGAAVVAPMMAVNGFDLYTPPDHIGITWYDYATGPNGDASPNNKPTDYPTWQKEFPYRAVFFSAMKESSHSPQYYDTRIIVVLSKTASIDLFDFEYLESRGTWGHIRAKTPWNSKGVNEIGTDKNVVVYTSIYAGVQYGDHNLQMAHFSNISGAMSGAYFQFDFDFYYVEDGTGLNISGLRSVSGVPYGYMIWCSHAPGGPSSGGENQSGGGSSGGGSDGGGSSGGGSSGGGTPDWGDYEWSSSSEPGPGAGWDESSTPGKNEGTYPWEDDDNVPDLDLDVSIPEYPGGEEGDTDEKGDTWTLPEYIIPDLPFGDDDLNIPEMPDLSFPELELPEPDPPGLEYEPDWWGGWPPPFPGTSEGGIS